MIGTMWNSAPTGVPGSGSLAAPTVHCLAERPVSPRLRALPLTAAVAGPRPYAPVIGTAVTFGLLPTGRGGDVVGTSDDLRTHTGVFTENQQNDGTTLGLHSSRRPLS